MSGGPVRPFNAINGDELRKLIENSLKRTLTVNPLYTSDKSYLEAKYRYSLLVEAYPMEPPNFTIELKEPKLIRNVTGDKLCQAIIADLTNNLVADSRFRHHLAYPQVSFKWKTAVDATESGPVIEIDDAGALDVSAPSPGGVSADAARRDANLGVPVPTTVRGPSGDRVTVDSTGVGPKGPTTTRTDNPTREVSTQTDVPHGEKVFARSVTQRTAAAPEGVAVDIPAGSKPDMERVQEILSKEEGDAAIDRSTPDPAA